MPETGSKTGVRSILKRMAGETLHLRRADGVTGVMADMLVALVPLLCFAVYAYGVRALILTAVSVISCAAFEYLFERIFHGKNTLGDLSAVVTGVLLSLCLPVSVPLWFPAVGALFAVVAVKGLGGGVGRNRFNPAAGAVCLLMAVWPGTFSVYPLPFSSLPWLATPRHFETGRTALFALKAGIAPNARLTELLLGNGPGPLGTGMLLLILAAGLYLIIRRAVRWQAPAAFLGTAALIAALLPRDPAGPAASVAYELCSGSLLFVAILMAGDPVTTPRSAAGRLLFGVFAGAFTMLLRYCGAFPEGAFFALLLVNPFAPAFDALFRNLRSRDGSAFGRLFWPGPWERRWRLLPPAALTLASFVTVIASLRPRGGALQGLPIFVTGLALGWVAAVLLADWELRERDRMPHTAPEWLPEPLRALPILLRGMPSALLTSALLLLGAAGFLHLQLPF